MDTPKKDQLGEPVPTGTPYGPGKFSTDVDAWLYARTLHGGADEQLTVGEGAGWYGLVHFDAEEQTILNTIEGYQTCIGCIMFERSDGIVEIEYFSDPHLFKTRWKVLEWWNAE